MRDLAKFYCDGSPPRYTFDVLFARDIAAMPPVLVNSPLKKSVF